MLDRFKSLALPVKVICVLAVVALVFVLSVQFGS